MKSKTPALAVARVQKAAVWPMILMRWPWPVELGSTARLVCSFMHVDEGGWARSVIPPTVENGTFFV